MLERRIYNSWAYSQNETEKSEINREIYEEIKDKAEVEWVGSGYGHTKYKVISNPNNLSELELALICDSGNLCFGYRTEGGFIVIHTD